ncbi:GtrA-like protein [Roseivivax jejudonensis]|uniref:GtrA-like protein n=1 Tax=Roseivivax jejudonensis TaxID=1529041 RepID=A0A1X6ZYX3_9RHOB|nr:GtrA family protein [Roseivivax jejudonensis]SLN65184.1 GtrA-like protein [Roseivivax jejudonensis]
MARRSIPHRGLRDAHPFVRYAAAAAICVATNLAAQEAVVQAAPGAPLMVSIVIGTGVGFLVKHVIDKTWTFREPYITPAAEARRITLSGLFSVLTTVIFWGFELGFYVIWGTDAAKYTGAVLGLGIGYVVKYMLDRRMVFREATV